MLFNRGLSLPDVASGGMQDIPSPDLVWIESRNKKGAMKLEKLDTDLKNYRSNSIKESIRRGNDDLGDHHLDCGDLSNALKCYSRARDYCTSGKHVVNMCLNVIKVMLLLKYQIDVYVKYKYRIAYCIQFILCQYCHSYYINILLK